MNEVTPGDHKEWCIKTETIAMTASAIMDLSRMVTHASQMRDSSLSRDLENVLGTLRAVYRRHANTTAGVTIDPSQPPLRYEVRPCEDWGRPFLLYDNELKCIVGKYTSITDARTNARILNKGESKA